jgi:uncharacterized protein (DUF1015 family)
MRIKPFTALRPPPALAARVASPPYDVVDTTEARALAEGHPMCFLRVSRPELELPEGTGLYDEAVYQRAAENFRAFQERGYLVRAPRPALYLYRLDTGAHRQDGVVAVCHVEDYERDLIRKHEHTRKATEDDRTRHTQSIQAHSGPVFLAYRDQPDIEALKSKIEKSTPLYDFAAPDGVHHTLWEIEQTEAWVEAFGRVPVAYVADGHHRAASAARVARERRAANPRHTGEEEYNWFLAVLFPAGQLRILPYNRCVRDLNGLDAAAFLAAVRQHFDVSETAPPAPEKPGCVSMYLGGRWRSLAWTPDPAADLVAALDVSVLQDRLLGPVLGIDDPRRDPRIEFVGGLRGAAELERRVDSGWAAAAFSMYPTRIDQLLAVADAGRVMPPKSTWFEPKLKSGLLVHSLD